jgi:Na+-driven multidrug efflux pump
MLVRPYFAMLAVNVLGLGLAGAWYALVADQLLRSGLVLLRYRSGRWKNVRIK